jgi:hypothetical protein
VSTFWETEVLWRSNQLDYLRTCEAALRQYAQDEGDWDSEAASHVKRATRAVEVAKHKLEEAQDHLRAERDTAKRLFAKRAAREVASYLDEQEECA